MPNRQRITKLQSFVLLGAILTLLLWFRSTAFSFSPVFMQGATIVRQVSVTDRSEFYVATNGTLDGDGSEARPWDLQTALNQPAAVQPGDTIWLRGGTYTGPFTSHLTGTADAPIVVRSAPGEWAVIDGATVPQSVNTFEILGEWTHYRDLEITSSQTTTDRARGLLVVGANNTLINLVIHDLGNNFFKTATTIYGSILYNNGYPTGHQLYVQNEETATPFRIHDCMIFNGFNFGIHAYGEAGRVQNIEMVGNVVFNNGAAQQSPFRKDNILVGAFTPLEMIVLRENLSWAAAPGERSVALGRYNDTNNQGLILIDNYLVGETKVLNEWQNVTLTGNTFYGLNTDGSNVNPAAYPDNSYLTAPPSGTRVFIRPNAYEPGRAHIIVYNWDDADTVTVDLKGVLEVGASYEIRNAQNYFAAPIESGTYDGTPVTLTLAGLSPAQPLGAGQIEPSEYTGTAFNVFVLLNSAASPGRFKLYVPIAVR